MGKTLVILDPSGIPPPLEKVRPAARPASREGVRLGLLDNTKPNSDKLLRRLEEKMRGKYPIASFTHYRKGGSALPLEEDLIDRMAAECDFVVNAVPD